MALCVGMADTRDTDSLKRKNCQKGVAFIEIHSKSIVFNEIGGFSITQNTSHLPLSSRKTKEGGAMLAVNTINI